MNRQVLHERLHFSGVSHFGSLVLQRLTAECSMETEVVVVSKILMGTQLMSYGVFSVLIRHAISGEVSLATWILLSFVWLPRKSLPKAIKKYSNVTRSASEAAGGERTSGQDVFLLSPLGWRSGSLAAVIREWSWMDELQGLCGVALELQRPEAHPSHNIPAIYGQKRRVVEKDRGSCWFLWLSSRCVPSVPLVVFGYQVTGPRRGNVLTSSIINNSSKQTSFKDLCDVDMNDISSSISSLELFTHLQSASTLYVHGSCARLQEENPQLPATTSPGDWGKLEVNRRPVVPVRALRTWVSGSESDPAPVPVWLPVCLDGPSPEGAVVHWAGSWKGLVSLVVLCLCTMSESNSDLHNISKVYINNWNF